MKTVSLILAVLSSLALIFFWFASYLSARSADVIDRAVIGHDES